MRYLGLKINLSTRYGRLKAYFIRHKGKTEGIVLMKRPWPKRIFVRLQSTCLFSEAFATDDCDCALQLEASLKELVKRGGVIIYLDQEGRGLGLEGKFKAIKIQQEKGVDTAQAYKLMGVKPDLREYKLPLAVLREISIPKQILLATNNPLREKVFRDAGYDVKRYQLKYRITNKVKKYLMEKQKVLNHHEPRS
jgi:GTP cyclohydrolase II